MDLARSLSCNTMKVLLTHERFLPDFGGGGEHIVAETALQLIKRGIDVQVLTTGDPRVASYRDVPTARLPMSRYRFNLTVRRIARMAAGADLIHTFSYHACLPSLLAGRAVRKPVVCTCLALFRDAWLAMRGPFAGRAFRAWERFLTTLPYTRTLFLSEYSRDQGLALGVSSHSASVSYPGFDSALFVPAPQKEDFVLFAGKFEIRKGIFDVTEVARALPQVRFRMIGWGSEIEALRRAAPANVTIARETGGGNEYRALLSRARIFFFPSKAETFGISLVEAMASGCAIVSSVPLDFAGIRVAAGDHTSMTRAIAQLWNSPQTCGANGYRNVQLAAQYTWDRYADAVIEAYSQVMPASLLAATATGISL
jgi:glycosyltransferase involved in cell wall biosynthesis